MKFQTGDKVVIQHSNEEGEVVEIINDKMVIVDVRGVRFPAYTDQLDFPYFSRFMEKKQLPPQKPKKYVDQVPREPPVRQQRIANLAEGVWLCCIPVFDSDEFGDDVVTSLKLHLVNNTKSPYLFTYRLNHSGETGFELDNQVFSFQDFYLHDISFDSLNDNPAFQFIFSLTHPDKYKAGQIERILKLRAKQVFHRIEEIKEKGAANFSFLLFDEYPAKTVEEPVEPSLLKGSAFRIYEASKARQHLESARQELDLHIEKLVEKPAELDPFEILGIQLQAFEKYLDLAMAHRLPSMTIIHGLGSGKLRDEIHEALRLKKGVKSFVNRYDPRYGYGATEVFFQY